MDITEGTVTAPPAPVINFDHQAMADAIVSGIKQANSTVTQPTTEDELYQAISELRARGLSDEQIAPIVTGLVSLEKKALRQAKQEINETTNRVLLQARTNEALAAIARNVRILTKDDELLKEVASSIKDKAWAAYINSREPEVVTARSRHANGTAPLDEDVLEVIVEREVERINKKRGGEAAKKTGAPAIGASTVSRPETSAQPATDLDQLTDFQRARFDDLMSGYRRIGKDPKVAKEEALKHVRRWKR